MPDWEIEELTPVKALRQFRLTRERAMGQVTVVYVQEVDLPSGCTFWCGVCGHTAFSCEHVLAAKSWSAPSPAVKG